MLRIADSHAHIYPDAIAGRALKQIASFYHFEDRMNEPDEVGSVDYLLRVSGESGIAVSLVCEAAHKPELVETLNRFVEESAARSGGRLLGLSAIHPGCTDIEDILADCKRRGFRGVKIHPDYQGFDMDDAACDPIYRFCEREQFPILVHCGDDRYDHDSPERLQRVLDRYPDMPLIAAHFGGYRNWDRSIHLRPSRGLWFDTSSSLFLLDRETVLRFFETFGYERFLFGTDYPLGDIPTELRRFLDLRLPAREQEKILWGNFARLFSLPEEAGDIPSKDS
ncbi:MAG: amidohydrolase family protein [Provencibacterium sp.]|nr:amidohydrolase family protein [Provencibacterium sp.]